LETTFSGEPQTDFRTPIFILLTAADCAAKEIKEQWQAIGNVTKGGAVLDTTRSDGAPGLFYLTKKVGDISNQEVEITGVGIIQRAGAGRGIDIAHI
jgi:hypothetical protein